MGSRDVARGLITLRCDDARDRKYLTELTRRVSKALRNLKQEGVVHSSPDNRGNLYWEILRRNGKPHET